MVNKLPGDAREAVTVLHCYSFGAVLGFYLSAFIPFKKQKRFLGNRGG